jgi:hypothetical protein
MKLTRCRFPKTHGPIAAARREQLAVGCPDDLFRSVLLSLGSVNKLLLAALHVAHAQRAVAANQRDPAAIVRPGDLHDPLAIGAAFALRKLHPEAAPQRQSRREAFVLRFGGHGRALSRSGWTAKAEEAIAHRAGARCRAELAARCAVLRRHAQTAAGVRIFY